MQATSFQVTIVSNPTDTNPQRVDITMWAVNLHFPNSPVRADQTFMANDPTIQSLLIEYTKLLTALKTSKGVE